MSATRSTKRKTITVEAVIEMTNAILSLSGADQKDARVGASSLLESILHETGNYRGFSYLRSEWEEDGSGLREGYDETRRRYY